MLHDQWILKRGEDERQRRYAEHLEADPGVGGLRAPDDLVEHRERQEEQGPAYGELAPALLGQVEHLIEHGREQWLAQDHAAEQRAGKQQVDDRRLHLDEGVVLKK